MPARRRPGMVSSEKGGGAKRGGALKKIQRTTLQNIGLVADGLTRHDHPCSVRDRAGALEAPKPPRKLHVSTPKRRTMDSFVRFRTLVMGAATGNGAPQGQGSLGPPLRGPPLRGSPPGRATNPRSAVSPSEGQHEGHGYPCQEEGVEPARAPSTVLNHRADYHSTHRPHRLTGPEQSQVGSGSLRRSVTPHPHSSCIG